MIPRENPFPPFPLPIGALPGHSVVFLGIISRYRDSKFCGCGQSCIVHLFISRVYFKVSTFSTSPFELQMRSPSTVHSKPMVSA